MGRRKLCIKIKKYIFKSILFWIICCFISIIAYNTTVNAVGWVDHNDRIYTQEEPKTSKKKEDVKKETFEIDEEPGFLEKIFGELMYSVGNWLHTVFESFGFDIDTVILGRLKYGKSDANLFGFDLSKGNVYGIMSMSIYGSLLSIVWTIMVIMMMAITVKHLYKNNAESRGMLKTEIVGMVIVFVVLPLMPYILDICIYLRDAFLAFLRDKLTNMMGTTSLGLWDSLSYAYEKSGHAFVPGCLCIGVTVLTIFFMYNYLMIALTMVLLVIAFLIICCFNSNKRKTTLENWLSMCLTNLLIPIFDFILIILVGIIPLISGNSLAVSIVQLMLAWNIRKARSIMLNILALKTAQPLDGLGGMFGLMAAGRLFGGLTNGVRNLKDNISGGIEDKKNAKTEREMGEIDGDESTIPERVEDDEYNDVSQDNENEESSEQNDNYDEDTDGLINEEDMENTDDESMSSGDSDSGTEQDIGEDNENTDEQIDSNRAQIDELDKANSELENELSSLENKSESDSKKADSIRSQIAQNNKKKDELKAENEALQSHSSNSTESGTKNGNMNNSRQNVSGDAQTYNSGNDSYQKNSQPNSMNISDYGSQFTKRYNPETATPQERRMHDLALKRANVRNFDSPDMRGLLSHKEMAKFYDKRAKQRFISAGVGVTISVLGGTIGMAAMSWMGPAAMGIGYGAGFSAGSSVGNAVGNIYLGANKAGEAIGSIKGKEKGRKSVSILPNGREVGSEISTNDVLARRPVYTPNENDYVPTSVLNSDKEGIMTPFNENYTVEDRYNSAAKNAAMYDGLGPNRKNVLMQQERRQIERAIRNNEILNNQEQVRAFMEAKYKGGMDKLSVEEQQKAKNFIDDFMKFYNK